MSPSPPAGAPHSAAHRSRAETGYPGRTALYFRTTGIYSLWLHRPVTGRYIALPSDHPRHACSPSWVIRGFPMSLRPFPEAIETHLSEILPTLTETRHDIHRHPEIGFKEVRTAGIVAKRLRELGLEVTENIGTTGVVGTLRSGSGTRAIGFRADMDALAMNEATGLPYASGTPCLMHGCAIGRAHV